MTNIISLQRITKIYPGSKTKALEQVDLEIRQGEYFCLVGTSGSGKSTILKIISKIEKPSSGEIQSPDSIAMVFQLGALLPWLTVEENVIFPLKMKGVPKEIGIAKNHLDMVKLENFENKYPRELSGGQRQRVGIARALAVNPQVLLLDEPFSALDPLTTEELYKDFLKIWEETKKTIIMVSHYLEEAVLLSDRIGCMKNGKLTGVVNVDLERPRSIGSKGFEEKLKQIKFLIS